MKKYKIYFQNSGKVSSKIVDFEDIDSFCKEKNIIKIEEKRDFSNKIFKKRVKISNKDLTLLFYELNLMLNSNINISDALEILIKNKKKRVIVDFLNKINYALSNSKPLYELLKEFKIEEFVKDFLVISQNSSNLNSNIEAISTLLKEKEELKKSFFKAISYPIFLTLSFFSSLFMIFLFVVPNFKSIFAQNINALPLSTKILLQSESFFKEYYLFFVFFPIVAVILIIFFYKFNQKFSYFIDKLFFLKIPVVSKIYQNLEFYKLFLLIHTMQKSKYEFHKAFVNSKLLVRNKYLLDKISRIDNLLENGKTICYSFEKSSIFDDIVLNLLGTGEISNSLEIVIFEIQKIYKERFNNSVKFLILLIQPIFLVVMASMILFIIVAIFTPIWDMGNMIQ